jgi:hypothetical protein
MSIDITFEKIFAVRLSFSSSILEETESEIIESLLKGIDFAEKVKESDENDERN